MWTSSVDHLEEQPLGLDRVPLQFKGSHWTQWSQQPIFWAYATGPVLFSIKSLGFTDLTHI